MTKSTRVVEMTKHFMELHNEGYSIAEIADLYNLSLPTVYKYLQEIADSAGVNRDELLLKNYPSNRMSPERLSPVEKTNLEELYDGFEEIISTIDRELSNLEKFLRRTGG